MTEIVMPRLSDSMEEGTILAWLKQVGDEIAVGEELVEIETDKANMAYEADVAGTLTEILAEEGATLPIGQPIARIGDSSDGGGDSAEGQRRAAAGTAAPTAEAQEASSAGEQAPDDGNGAPPAAEAGERVKASPVAKRLAKEKGIEIARLTGSGPGGRIVKADVEKAKPGAAAQAPSAAAPEAARVGGETAKGSVEVVEPNKLQQTVARRMAESKATAPHFYLEAEIDMTACFEGRQRLKEGAGDGSVVPSFNDMVVKACAIALREFPKPTPHIRTGASSSTRE